MRGLRKTRRQKRKQIGRAYGYVFENADDACLQLAKASEESEAKKIYRDAGRKFHPDKGGNEEDFKKLGDCFETFWPGSPSNTQAETARFKRETYLQEKDPQSAPPRQSARQQAARQQAAREEAAREAQRRADEEEAAREAQRRAAPPPQPAPPPPRHSASQQSAREQSAREQADREASRQKYARWKAAQEAAREKAAREKYAEEAAHHSRMKAARQEAARKRAAEEEAEAALREAERKKAAAEEAAQIRANREKAKKKADSRKAEEKERIQKVNAYNKAVRLKGSDAISSAMDIDSVSKRDIKQKANQYYLEKYPSLRSNFLTDPDYYGPIIEQILNGDPSNYEKLFKELSNYNSPAVLRRFRFGSSRGRLPSLPTRRARRFSSSKKRRYSRRQRA